MDVSGRVTNWILTKYIKLILIINEFEGSVLCLKVSL